MKLVHTLIFISFSTLVFSQTKPPTYNDYFQEGSYLLLENSPEKALENFEIAYKLDSSSANINAMLGSCYLQSKEQKAKAEYYLEKAVKNISKNYKIDDPSEKFAPPIAQLYYGQALHINYKF